MHEPNEPPARVAIVSRAARGGHPRYCAELAVALSKAGAAVTIIEPADAFASTVDLLGGLPVQNAPISEPKAGWLRQEFEIAKILLASRKTGGTVVFQDSSSIRILLVAALRFLSSWKPVTMIHNTRPHNSSFRERVKHSAAMSSLAVPHQVLTHNERQRSDLAELPLVPADRISLVPHGVWTSPATDSHGDLQKSRKHLLMFGVMRDNSGLDKLLEIAPTLDAEFPDIHIDVVGQPASPNAARLLTKLDTYSTIHVRDEYVTDEDAAALFAKAKFVLLPYVDYTSESGVLLMAIKHGSIVITMGRSSIADRVTEFGLGPAPTGTLLDQIRTALRADETQLEVWSTNAAGQVFRWDRHAEVILNA